MANKMLIDASHPEETRVVVVRGNRVEEFDFEAANRRQLRGNIYLAKVTRVEPSLQACFVDYGGNRHGFLAFSEIHPDYYQIPVADRQALIEEEERAAREAEERRNARAKRSASGDFVVSEPAPAREIEVPAEPYEGEAAAEPEGPEEEAPLNEAPAEAEIAAAPPEAPGSESGGAAEASEAPTEPVEEAAEEHHEEEAVEQIGGGALEEVPERQPRRHRRYKIQEVIKRRQVMLVQVVKEERGTKGAALTTYLSLAGRYSVLMPNTSRGGGISRKITSSQDRQRLKELVEDLEVPEGMGVILRTAGAARTKAEIKRDFEYLLRLWETVRELTLKSQAPALVYEEGSLTKRAIRDLYNKDIDEVMVAGEDGYHEAKEFMRTLMPSHADNVHHYREPQPIFVRYGIEHQLDAMFSPTVQLKSGGYVVMNPTEALVAIDVNSGRATREHHIEDTALKTNLEAAEEIARQLRLRDLAGLIVIDFIDMEEKRNNRHVERKLKDALKHDRARIQVGRISHFGLMEMSRQRIRTGVLESSTEICPACGGTGHVRSVSSVALQLLRSIEDQLMKGASHDLVVRTKPDIALYVLNNKRAHLRGLEEHFGAAILIQSDAGLAGQQYFAIERGPLARPRQTPLPHRIAPDSIAPEFADEEEGAAAEEIEEAAHGGGEREEEGGGRRRRRRGRRGRGGRGGQREPQREPMHAQNFGNETATEVFAETEGFVHPTESPETAAGHERDAHHGDREPQPRGENGERRRRRRGRRGGRRNRRDRLGHEPGPESEPLPGGQDPSPHFSPENSTAREHFEPEPPRFEPQEPAPVAAVEAPKRRSTVREAAPVVSEEGYAASPAAPAPTPASRAREEEAAPDRPRRSGWWSKR
ncbi:MAG TPA: ribonuclease E/G [Xanthobacteraceae bacterium]|nr:ribonuclease E/G [Xanthobacteraceae bacterium]